MEGSLPRIVLIVYFALYMHMYSSSAQEYSKIEYGASDDDHGVPNAATIAFSKFLKRFQLTTNATHFGSITHRHLCENYAGIIVTKIKRTCRKNIQATCEVLENSEFKEDCVKWMKENFSPSPLEVLRNAEEVLSVISVKQDTDSTSIISIREDFARECEKHASSGLYIQVIKNSCMKSVTAACELATLPYVEIACKLQLPTLVCR